MFSPGQDDAFAIGSAQYIDAFPGLQESQPRIYVKFRPQGTEIPFLALLDTGAHFCILNRDIIPLIAGRFLNKLSDVTLQTARGPVGGELYLHTIELLAEQGRNLKLNSTLFVAPEWTGPSFLGYTGALDRIRFAIDPQSNGFYCGPLG